MASDNSLPADLNKEKLLLEYERKTVDINQRIQKALQEFDKSIDQIMINKVQNTLKNE